MLKPWVVYTLLWMYKGGLLLVLPAVVLLGCRRTAFPVGTRFDHENLKAAGICVYAVAGLAGAMVGFAGLTVVAAVICLTAYGLCRLTRHAWIPLLFLAWISLPVGSALFDDQHNEYVPKREVRLSQELVCRAYPKQFDSITGTRLVAAHTNVSWFRDEIVEGPSTASRMTEIRCALTPGGQLTMEIQFEGGEKTVKRKLD